MRVLLVWNGPETPAERTVAARRDVPLLQALESQGIRATVALFGDAARLRDDLEAARIDVRYFATPLAPSAKTMAVLPRAAMQLRRLVRETAPDVLEASEPMPAIALGLAAWPRERRGVVVYRRQHGGGRRRAHLASRVAARLSDRTIVSCEAMRARAALDDGTPIERIVVSTSGTAELPAVDDAAIADARRSLGIGAEATVIGVVSRLRREKGIDVLLEAMNELADAGDVHLVIVGHGPDDARLRELARGARVPVHFTGYRDDVAVWYALSDAIAMPSRIESFGRVTVEAMAAGKPLVASREGGLADAVIDGETGMLVAPDDPRALAAALRALVTDRALARRLGAAARQRYESHYTIAHMAAARRRAWERILAP